jgi:urease accessory protein UreH
MKTTIVFQIIFLALLLSCKSTNTNKNQTGEDWWSPIISKHKIEKYSFNNYKNYLEISKDGNSISADKVELKNATLIINEGNYYLIATAPIIYKTKKDSLYFIINGSINKFNKNDLSIKSIEHWESDTLIIRSYKEHSEILNKILPQ